MSTRDVIKKSVLGTFTTGALSQTDLPRLLGALAAALLMGCLIFAVYRRFYQGVVFSRGFALTLVGMTVLTCMVTLAISTNIVISLGMVGALSIVRFRTAIKDPMDLLYLFWAITTGITVGAGLYLLSLAAAGVMVLMLLAFRRAAPGKQVFIVVVHCQGDLAGDEVLRAFGRLKYYIKSRTLRADCAELAVEVFCRPDDTDFMEKLRAVDGVQDATLVQYNGEYHG